MKLVRSSIFGVCVLSCLAINVFISGMSLIGSIINIIPIFLLHPKLNLPGFDKFFLFFVFNILLGPFILVNLDELGLVNLGRIDYFVGNIILIYYLLIQSVYKIRRSEFVFIIVLSIFLLFGFIIDPNELVYKINVFYGFYSKLSIAFFFYILISRVELISHTMVKKVVFLFVFLHLSLSIVQLFYPIYIRVGSIEAGIHIGGVLFNRPLGFFESSFVYGVHTIFLCFVFIKLCGRSRINDIIVFLLCLISFLSTRSALLAFLVFIFILIIRNNNNYFKTSIILITTIVVLNFSYNNIEMLLIDQSNSTKLLLWYLTLKEYLFNSDFVQIIFGHGVGSSSNISLELPNFVSNLNFDTVYDNRVDLKEGFPIHNVYVQILFEHGIFIFLAIIIPVIKSLIFVIRKDTDLFLSFLILTIFFQYLLHNGMFAVYLLLLCFIGQGKFNNE